MISVDAMKGLDARDCRAVFDKVAPTCNSNEFESLVQSMDIIRSQLTDVGKMLAYELLVKLAACVAQLPQ